MANEVTLSGLDDLLEELQDLPRELSSKNGGIVRRALYQGAKIVREEATRRAPKQSGNLAKNIIMVRDRQPQRANANERYLVGVRGGARKKLIRQRSKDKLTGRTTYVEQGNAFYWRYVEFGTNKMPARPFLRPAMAARSQEALNTVIEGIQKGIFTAQRKVARSRT